MDLFYDDEWELPQINGYDYSLMNSNYNYYPVWIFDSLSYLAYSPECYPRRTSRAPLMYQPNLCYPRRICAPTICTPNVSCVPRTCSPRYKCPSRRRPCSGSES
jgi:hypothetical protein